jgi:hypothetical protein
MSKPTSCSASKALPNTPSSVENPGETCGNVPMHNKVFKANHSMQNTGDQHTQQTNFQDTGDHGEPSRPETPPATARLIDSEPEKSVERANEDLRKLQMTVDELTAELASQHSNDPYRVGDDKIGRERDVLRQNIRHWSRNFNCSRKKTGIQNILWPILPAEEECPFGNVTPQYEAYLSDKTGKGIYLLVQGYVWKKLLKEVFDHYLWACGQCKKGSRYCEIYESFDFLNSFTLRRLSQNPVRIYH